MNAEVKLSLIERITHIDDEVLLEEINYLIDKSKDPEKFDLSKTQTEAVKIAERQISRGEIFTNEQAKRDTEKWFGK